jgi:hypothetical protein
VSRLESHLLPWSVAGTYFEACSCEAICPCRSIGGRRGGRSTFGVCDFALSWRLLEGRAGALDLAGFAVVLVGSYDDDESGSPWRVALYVDERADDARRFALTEIFLGRAGGTTFRNFASLIGEVYAIRSAHIELVHAPNNQGIEVERRVLVRGSNPVHSDESISCGIPGHDHPGQEVTTELQLVDEPPLKWVVRGRCGFATDFAYSSTD